MSTTTIIGYLSAPSDPAATAVTIEESGTLGRSPTTVVLLRNYWPVGTETLGFRYSAQALTSGMSLRSGAHVTLPAAEADALVSAGAAMAV